MPKRDEVYMMAQRDRIARAALTVFLEKGLYATSMRDICEAAGVSIGAFYNLFPTKADAVVAARYISMSESGFISEASSWPQYVASLAAAYCSRRPEDLRHLRLGLQLAAEVMQMDRNPEGLSEVYDIQRKRMADNLKKVFDRGEVSLPLGLERTVEVHAQIALGALFRLSNDHDFSVEDAVSILEDGLATSAGLIPRASTSRAPKN